MRDKGRLGRPLAAGFDQMKSAQTPGDEDNGFTDSQIWFQFKL